MIRYLHLNVDDYKCCTLCVWGFNLCVYLTRKAEERIGEPDFIYTSVQADAQHRPRRSRLERAAHNGYGSYHTQMT